MLDLHIHIIPGVDDGAQDYDDAIGMAELALESGVTTVIATPHANQRGRFENYYTNDFARRYERLEEMLRSNRLDLNILVQSGMDHRPPDRCTFTRKNSADRPCRTVSLCTVRSRICI